MAETLVPSWPIDGQCQVVFVTDVSDRHEFQLLTRWLKAIQHSHGAPEPEVIRFNQSQVAESLVVLAAREDTTWLQPVRVAWLALESTEPPSLVKDFFHGRRINPGLVRRRWLARYRPDRVAYVTGDGAHLGSVRGSWASLQDAGDNNLALEEYIGYQVNLTLERAERRLRGARYRIARLMPKIIFASNEFQARLKQIALDQSRALEAVRRKAGRYLHEMAATQTPFSLDIIMALSRLGCRSNHDAVIDVRADQIQRLRALLDQETVTFQITHKSMLDTVAFSLIMFEANLPVPLTFGGINLRTFGVGALARRAGIIFLRRSFQNNELYKTVFRRYIDHLIEKRFSVVWALEGGRSRTGKLMPPRFGLFNYVLESSLRTGNEDLFYVPVSVAYDQITEVGDYAKEQRGRAKSAEGMGWMLRFFKRGGSHGKIYIRFGEPFQIKAFIADASLASITPNYQQDLVRKIAFESANRLNAVTPVTVPAIMTLILLGSGRRAQQLGEIQLLARAGAAMLRRRKVEIVGHADFRDVEAVRVALNQLNKTGIVSYFDDGLERLYRVEPGQQHIAAYYRNTVIHHFLLDAIAEIALLEARKSSAETRLEHFYLAAEQLRELFLFEFFFPSRAEFRAALGQTLNSKVSNWAVCLEQNGVDELLSQFAPLFAHGVLRAFVDAYRIVAAYLVRMDNKPVKSDGGTMTNLMKLGRQMLLQEVVFSSESVSKPLYETAFQAAEARNLLVPSGSARPQPHAMTMVAGDPDETQAALHQRRIAWLRQLQDLSKQLDQIMVVTLSRGISEFR